MSEGKKIVEDSTYFGSEDFMNAARKAGHKPDGQAVVVHGPQLAGVIDNSLSYARRAELKLIKMELELKQDVEAALEFLEGRLYELEWGKKRAPDIKSAGKFRITRPIKTTEHALGIHFIKEVRVYTGLGLREAKDLYDAVVAAYPESHTALLNVKRIGEFTASLAHLGFTVETFSTASDIQPADDAIFHVATPK